ncbi:hypothetical protein [Hymenobacter crusticola]|uniref:Uncharacterized protein n=1 Tax=Hymenobacter crusticola TaxID=1770526 RepID=A0A243W5P5_9BACT|nr:hypothetical protein [Hymenobacter crusticola]OUJ68992.1 hypothetical protein BXP70_27190 [Hymenobacter crusticola]
MLRSLLTRIKTFLRRHSLREEVNGFEPGVEKAFTLDQLLVDASLSGDELLRSIERQIVQSPVEIGVLFDQEGNLLVSRTGTTSGINFVHGELVQMEDGILTHNHPRGSYFSEQDLYFACDYNLAELRAVAGKKVHRLIRPPAGWDSIKLRNLWNSELRKLQHNYKQNRANRSYFEKQAHELPLKVVKLLSLYTEPQKL